MISKIFKKLNPYTLLYYIVNLSYNIKFSTGNLNRFLYCIIVKKIIHGHLEQLFNTIILLGNYYVRSIMKYKLTLPLMTILIFSQGIYSMDKEVSKTQKQPSIENPTKSKPVEARKDLPTYQKMTPVWILGWTGICYGIYKLSQILNQQ